ncbi:hypothetical protein OD91_2524 [Lutibacter sp. Hel_I_33_5]|uniref:DUF6090 family protein n=1 Tax=Lutibacter sp. Hel_I_33_5 TaxID=1566289 RepID=UPI00119F867A|nr:DUF6090 family protein [Lutibacter sp. Hel_I_33_5]TVZ57209.1 hypothetical protein OD91_2524 [Lutibacter sp. Hel_I_33_5]
MTRLFRKVKQKFLNNNKFSKYLLYAFGEVFLVMIGILLALQFNNLNAQKENSKKEKWYLTNIVEDLEYQKVILKDMIDHYEESIEIEEKLISDYQSNFSFSKIDSLDDKLNYLTITYDYSRVDNTYKELITSGQFNLISDKLLSINIINYYLLCEANDNDVNNDLNNIFYKEIYPAINKFSQITIDEPSTDKDNSSDTLDPSLTLYIQNKLKEPASKLELINAIKTKLVLQDNFLYLIKENLVENDSLIKNIDSYLGLNRGISLN